jgi:hypothetical protein
MTSPNIPMAPSSAPTPEAPSPDRAAVIKNFNSYGKMLERNNSLRDIASSLKQVAEAAEQITMEEQDDWFDKHTVGRNMKEIKKYADEFEKCAHEADMLQERLTALYDDMGMKLGRYFEIHDLEPEEREAVVTEAAGEEDDGKPSTKPTLMWSDKVGDVRVVACRHGVTANSPVSLTVTKGLSAGHGRFTKHFDSETELNHWYSAFVKKARSTGKADMPKQITDEDEVPSTGDDESESGTDKMLKLVKIVQSKQALKVDGRLVDVPTAEGILKVFQKLNPENKEKFKTMPIQNMTTIAHKIATPHEVVQA